MWQTSAILENSKMAAVRFFFLHFRPLLDVFPYCNVRPFLQMTENEIDLCFYYFYRNNVVTLGTHAGTRGTMLNHVATMWNHVEQS